MLSTRLESTRKDPYSEVTLPDPSVSDLHSWLSRTFYLMEMSEESLGLGRGDCPSDGHRLLLKVQTIGLCA